MLNNWAPSTPPRRSRKAVLLVVVGGLLIVGGVAFSTHKAVSKAVFAAPRNQPVAGWTINVAGDKTNGQTFGGRFAPGHLFFVPAGAAFSVRSEPECAAGMFLERLPAGAWDHDGGELNLAVPYRNAPSAEGFKQDCRAPLHPGLYHLFWQDADAPGRSLSLDVLSLTKAETHVQGGKTFVKVHGKSIGAYSDPAESSIRRVRENAPLYQPPLYFATLTQETIRLKLGEDFDLGQLVAFKDYHGPDGKKVYTTERHTDVLPLRAELIDKLVKLRQRLRDKGVKVTRFWITSGFRTPEYNHSIGGAAYSRHCYGDAVDLCIDEDGDKRMDDLNGDGRIDRKDGIVIANACRELEAEGAVVAGGIGVYEWDSDDSVRSHVHMDCRGFVTRWGQVGAGRYKKSFVWWPKAEFQEDESGE